MFLRYLIYVYVSAMTTFNLKYRLSKPVGETVNFLLMLLPSSAYPIY